MEASYEHLVAQCRCSYGELVHGSRLRLWLRCSVEVRSSTRLLPITQTIAMLLDTETAVAVCEFARSLQGRKQQSQSSHVEVEQHPRQEPLGSRCKACIGSEMMAEMRGPTRLVDGDAGVRAAVTCHSRSGVELQLSHLHPIEERVDDACVFSVSRCDGCQLLLCGSAEAQPVCEPLNKRVSGVRRAQ